MDATATFKRTVKSPVASSSSSDKAYLETALDHISVTPGEISEKV